MSTNVPPFPSVSSPPSIETMADLLASSLPDADRAGGRKLLAEEILPWQLRSLGEHPRPLALTQVVYEGIAGELDPAPSAERLAVLRRIALRGVAQRSVGEAVTLAIARYLIDHPEAEARVARWVTPEVRRWVAAGLDGVKGEAALARGRLDVLRHSLDADRALGEAHRLDLLHVQLALGSAETGSFATAAGPLTDFLRDAGEQPKVLDVH